MQRYRQFCRLCECPIVDGSVQASQVDKEKFQDWCLNFLGTEMAEDLKQDDVICNFCVWEAQILLDECGDDVDGKEQFEWWPNLRKIEHQDILIKSNYTVGRLKACWVLLEKISLSESTEDKEDGFCSQKKSEKFGKCFYCGEQKIRGYLAHHIRKMHKEIAIRCEFKNCATYFHTLEERKEHKIKVHETPKEWKIFKCINCDKNFKSAVECRKHIQKVHSEIEFKCSFYGCIFYAKTKSELDFHFASAHQKVQEGKRLSCEICGYRGKKKTALRKHISNVHLPKTIKCEKCGKMMTLKRHLKRHMKIYHTFKVCKLCQSSVLVQKFSNHFRKYSCIRCRSEFPCSGLLQSHNKICKNNAFKCEKCPKTFYQQIHSFHYHVKTHIVKDQWRGLKYKNLGIKCETCKKYFCSKIGLRTHWREIHSQEYLKFCAHCLKTFRRRMSLRNHLSMAHGLIEKRYHCPICSKSFYSKTHQNQAHSTAKEPKKCRLCGNLCVSMSQHMIKIHGVRE